MMSRQFDYTGLARCNDASGSFATIRQQADFFRVEEKLPFEPDGAGSHAFLYIEKIGCNTDWLAQQLAQFAGIPEVGVGYAGLKDRHAVTRQWFSINLQGIEEPDWSQFETERIRLMQNTRHGKKLKRGVLSGNHFTLILTDVTGDQSGLVRRLEAIATQGVPNYFAEQRFGHHFNNLYQVDKWFSGGRAPRKRHQRSLYLSAARSWLFNLVLSERVANNNWNQALPGDVMQLAGTRASYFVAQQIDEPLQQRLSTHDIHITGPMVGKGVSLADLDCLELEQSILSDWQDWLTGLEKAGLTQERRALRIMPQKLNWKFVNEDKLELDFFLPAGSYATAVLRELAHITDASQRNSSHDAAFSELTAHGG